MTGLKRKSPHITALSLLGLIVFCIGLNYFGTKINAALGLPLFIDDIGTILSALLGGYVPCITVGFFSNIIAGIENSTSTYYCIISVFIAIAAVWFADKKQLTRFPNMLLGVLTFALLGGVGGGALTWLIFGFDFGEGFAVDLASAINNVVPIGYLPSNLISSFLIDFVDKLIVTLIALLIFIIIPKRFKEALKTQSWYYISFIMTRRKGSRFFSLSLKTTLLVVISTTLVASAAIGVSIFQYHNATIDRYIEEGKSAATVIAARLEGTPVEQFIRSGRGAYGYAQAEEMMKIVGESTPEIKYIYVYQVREDGTHVVFDLDTAETEGNEAGEVIRYDDTVKKYLDRFLSGEEIPTDVTNDSFGWLLSVYEPVHDSAGNVVCHVGVDMAMSRLKSEEFAFLTKIISLFIGFLILIRTYAVWAAERHIINPVNTLTDAVNNISFDTPEARAESVEMMENLDIHTGDEIESLYQAYSKTTSDTVKYIDEVQRSGERLEKMQNGLVMVLADMVESRDKCTGDHVRKTAAYTEIILRQMQREGIYADRISENFIKEVVNSAPLHDVGKIAVSDAILNKPGRLSDEEFDAMKKHTSAGGEIIDKAIVLVDEESDYLTEARNLAACHHEKWNGTGYPKGLAGEDIPLSARVMAVADVFDALVSRRSYKEPFTIEKALDIIREGSGSHFDPNVVKAFLDAEEEVRLVAAMNMDI